jgi:hypothetical protein
MNTAKRTLLTAAIATAAIAATAQVQVTFKGSVITLAPATERVHIYLLVNGNEREVSVSANGNFKFTVEAGQTVTMQSTCKGFVEKQVLIDASNAKKRTVNFDVELEAQDEYGSLYHPNPAGHIAFADGTGRLLVAYDNTLVRMDDHPLIAATP